MPNQSAPNEQAATASFVFRGTVEKTHAANIPEVTDTSQTATVRVDQTLQAPTLLSHYNGHTITVQMDSPEGLKAGDQAVFYADSWIFGNDGIAVHSHGHHAPGPELAAMHMTPDDPVANHENRKTQDHVDSADAVVSGTVESVGIAPGAERRGGPREHDAEWREANVRVDRTYKGEPGSTVVVRFPASHDRMWHQVPKLRAGDRGHFLLHKVASDAKYFTLLHAGDFEPDTASGPVHLILDRLANR
jgi:hypothetical protein